MRKGKLLIISGPSGVGKGTIVKQVIKKETNTLLSVSSTTRKPRPNEVNGTDYYFISKDEFEKKISNNEFAEYANYAGNYYGTDKSAIQNILSQGKNLILEIDVQGALQIKKIYNDAISIFILPPNIDELKHRLIGRNTEDISTINLRLSQVDRELNSSDLFDYKIINDDLYVAVGKIIKIINS